jgi:hypothetical protein
VTFYNADNTTSYHIAKTVSYLQILRLTYLQRRFISKKGDELRLAANADSDIEAVASYEEIS